MPFNSDGKLHHLMRSMIRLDSVDLINANLSTLQKYSNVCDVYVSHDWIKPNKTVLVPINDQYQHSLMLMQIIMT